MSNSIIITGEEKTIKLVKHIDIEDFFSDEEIDKIFIDASNIKMDNFRKDGKEMTMLTTSCIIYVKKSLSETIEKIININKSYEETNITVNLRSE